MHWLICTDFSTKTRKTRLYIRRTYLARHLIPRTQPSATNESDEVILVIVNESLRALQHMFLPRIGVGVPTEHCGTLGHTSFRSVVFRSLVSHVLSLSRLRRVLIIILLGSLCYILLLRAPSVLHPSIGYDIILVPLLRVNSPLLFNKLHQHFRALIQLAGVLVRPLEDRDAGTRAENADEFFAKREVGGAHRMRREKALATKGRTAVDRNEVGRNGGSKWVGGGGGLPAADQLLEVVEGDVVVREIW